MRLNKNVTIETSKSLTNSIVIQKVESMKDGRINPATLLDLKTENSVRLMNHGTLQLYSGQSICDNKYYSDFW
jgi:hypothetical protein